MPLKSSNLPFDMTKEENVSVAPYWGRWVALAGPVTGLPLWLSEPFKEKDVDLAV